MSRSRRQFIEQYADEDFELPADWETDALTIVEAKRICKFGLVACYAAEFPRRLGVEASGLDLAADKRLSRRIAYVYLGLWKRYTMSTHAPLPLEECPPDLVPPGTWRSYHAQAASEDDVRRKGASVVWESWWEDVRPRLLARRMMMATYAIYQNELNWGYRIVTSLTDEVGWIDDKFASYRSMLDRVKPVA